MSFTDILRTLRQAQTRTQGSPSSAQAHAARQAVSHAMTQALLRSVSVALCLPPSTPPRVITCQPVYNVNAKMRQQCIKILGFSGLLRHGVSIGQRGGGGGWAAGAGAGDGDFYAFKHFHYKNCIEGGRGRASVSLSLNLQR